MAAFTTIALAGAALAGLGYGIYSGEQAKAAQKQGLRRQEQAQKQAQALSIAQTRKADMATAAANRKTPDIGNILAFEQSLSGFGASARTGAAPADPSRLNLKRPVTTLGTP